MSRVVVIGATGHIGTYLVPRLVRGGHGREPVLDFMDWPEFERRAGTWPAEATREHTMRSITASIDRAREVLGYAPRYTTLEALRQALAWLAAHGQVDLGGQPFPADNGV
jgi:nucleoside-diphosphate-sugar epimerase